MTFRVRKVLAAHQQHGRHSHMPISSGVSEGQGLLDASFIGNASMYAFNLIGGPTSASPSIDATIPVSPIPFRCDHTERGQLFPQTNLAV
ncbi:hypothetical protein [Mesorhizobium caraganae]|uniref:hypothetical protein n=1 Tax=Mesorhizobium caraganae TaxID=483206 RepID=UPI001780DE77|nr:hypothetical protein [Mesorhizobium caraganae]